MTPPDICYDLNDTTMGYKQRLSGGTAQLRATSRARLDHSARTRVGRKRYNNGLIVAAVLIVASAFIVARFGIRDPP